MTTAMVGSLTVHSKHVLGIVPLRAKLSCGKFSKNIRILSLDSGRSVCRLDFALLKESHQFLELFTILSKWWWFGFSG